MSLQELSIGISLGFTIVVTLFGVGVQYGIYTSFKSKMEIEMKSLLNRTILLENNHKETDLKYATLISKFENLEKTTEKINESFITNWEKLFDKLEREDDKFNVLVEKVAKVSK